MSADTFFYGVGEDERSFTVEVPVFTCQECASSYTGEEAEKIRDKVVKDYLETQSVLLQQESVLLQQVQAPKTVATVRVKNLIVAINETKEGVRMLVLDDEKGIDEPVGDFYVGFNEKELSDDK
jgi:hypothetical protein